MNKLYKWILLFLLLAVLVPFFLPDTLPGWEVPSELPGKYQRKIQAELLEAVKLLNTVPEEQTAQEDALIQAGYSVLRSNHPYPSFLENAEPLTAFCNAMHTRQESDFSFFRILEDGGLRHLFFLHQNGDTLFFTTDAVLDGSHLQITDSSILPVYDMELSDWGIFYYQVYPANDPHYVDYAQIRLQPPDETLYDLARTYILPVGYQMVNLFLCDWQEGNWSSLSFPDLLEFLSDHNAGMERSWEQYAQYPRHGRCVLIPDTYFEAAILPYFTISREDLRVRCHYAEDARAYLWRPVRGDDLVTWAYPMCEPEVIACIRNPDGTLTLDVQVYSPEVKTDRLFCHRLTVRPLEDGRFQYVSNTVTDIGQWGLPYSQSRFELDS